MDVLKQLVIDHANRLVAQRAEAILKALEAQDAIKRDRISAMALLHLGKLSALASYGMPRDVVHGIVDEIYDRMVAEIRKLREKGQAKR